MDKLFGADGIRGSIDRYPFRAEDLICLGNSLARWWLGKTHDQPILIGTDTRESSQRIKVALVDGISQGGVEVWDAGILPTAGISFLVASQADLSGGVMISASHNPIVENGIKVFDGRGAKTSDADECEIESAFFSRDLGSGCQAGEGAVRWVSGLFNQYVEALLDEFGHIKWQRSKVLVDCANGASYKSAQSVLGKLGIRYVLQNAFPDGTNINYGAGSEHVRKCPSEFAALLRKSDLEVGIALDGDADRVVFVDRDGVFYDGDMLLAIVAHSLLDNHILKNNKVIITQMSNSGLAEHLSHYQVQTKQVRNGDKYITDTLLNEDLSLGGEQIGHLIIHTDHFHITGDGIRTALWVLAALSQEDGLTLRDLTRQMRKWPQINVSAGLGGRMLSKSEAIPGLEDLKMRVMSEIKDLSRFECRPASTEPVYRIMLEAPETPLPVLAGYAYGLARHVQQAVHQLGEPIEILDCVNGGQITPASVPYFLE
jgi:phosphoglucosamine mutase